MDKFLQLTIDEYAIPAFCSAYKYMYGTLEDMTNFVNYLRGVKRATPLVEAFDKYVAGDKKVKYNVAYNPMQLMHDCLLLESKEGIIKDFNYEFENIWGFIYDFQADEVCFKRVKLQYRNKIVIAIKPSFKNLRIKGDIGFGDVKIKNDYWGFPGIYNYDDVTDINETRIYLVEKVFDKKNSDEVERCNQLFENNEFCFDTCFEEIVADG